MAKVPIPEDRVVFQGVDFSPAPPVGGTQFPVSRALTQWAAERRQRLDLELKKRVQDEATLAQRARGIGGLAEPPDDLRPDMQEVFREQAFAVLTANQEAEALALAARLSRAHADDPQAFAVAYNAWMAPQVEAITNADPSESEATRLRLQEIGRRAMEPLIDRQQAKTQLQARLDYDEGLRSQLATLQDALRDNPDETLLSNSLAQMEETLRRGVESGLLTPEQFQRRVDNLRVDLPRNYAIGRFDAALARGDVSAAKAVIDRLEAGGLFDDNDAGLQTAALLRARLKERLAEVEGVSADQRAIWRRDVETYAALVRAGIDAELPQEAVDGLLAAGDQGDVDFLKRLQVTVAIQRTLRDAVYAMDLAAVAEAREQLADKADVLEPDQVRAIVEFLDQRQRLLEEVTNTGDYLKLLPDGERLEPLAEDAQQRAAFQQRNAINRQIAARIAGVPPELVPHRTDAQVKEARELFKRFREQRNFAAMQQTIERFLQPVLGDPFREFALAQQAGSPDMQAYSAIFIGAGAEVTDTIFAMSEQGARVRNEELQREVADKLGDVIQTVADTYSFGDSAVREALIVMLRDAALGIVVDNGGALTRKARAEFNRLIDPLTDTVKLANGHRLPRIMLGDEIQSKTLVREINRVLDEPFETFGVYAEDSLFLRSVRPIPGPSGQILFTSSRQPGRLLTDPETGEVIMINVAPKIEEARKKASERIKFFDFLRPNLDPLEELNTDAMSTMRQTVPRAARVTGAEPDLLEAMFRAAQSVPLEQRAGREPAFLLGPDTLRDLDREKFAAAWRATQLEDAERSSSTGALIKASPPKNPMTNRLAAAIAVGILQQQYVDRFQDADKALAAMWVGADFVENAIRTHGDGWKDALSDEALEYLRRVKDRL